MSTQNDDVEGLRIQLNVARKEISNLRQQLKNLSHMHRKDVVNITSLLKNFRCERCKRLESEEASENSINRNALQSSDVDASEIGTKTLNLTPIGTIKTSFPEKRAVPRQASVANKLQGVIQLNADVFNNPEHSLEGLEEFSHMWLIYYFNRNKTHAKAKVAPPRLEGQRVGVFSTRSPHRPNPIGLSLVEIGKIQGSTISFFGTDMVNDTPLLDLKPYIPLYDMPYSINVLDPTTDMPADFYGSRQEPDGEESALEMLGAAGIAPSNAHSLNLVNNATTPGAAVKVPNWISNTHRLTVQFNDRAERQLLELRVNRQCIIDILETDPRSVYLRTRYSSQIFTFQLSEVTVTCKFDDKASLVTVVQIRRSEHMQDDAVTSSVANEYCNHITDEEACDCTKNPNGNAGDDNDDSHGQT